MSRDARAAEPGHVPVLDGLRGLAILLVMACHLWCAPEWTWLDRLASTAARFGWVGVDLFFVLSGFLITGILVDSKGAPKYLRHFYMRRVLRIFPLYYCVLAASLFVLPHVLPPEKAARFGVIAGDEPYYWLYLSNFAIARAGLPRHGVLDVTWSLAIEEQFYLAWPAVVLLCRRRSLVRVAEALFVLTIAVRLGLHLASSYNAYSIYVLTPCRLDGLAVGAVLATWAREPGGLARLRSPARNIAWPALAAAVTLAVAEEVFGAPTIFGVGMGPVFTTAGFTLLALLFGALLVLAATAEPGARLHRVFSSPFLRMFGTYSYGLYLLHLPVRALIRDRVYGPSATQAVVHFPTLFGSEIPGQLLFYPIAGGAALAAAWLSFHVVESPFLKLKRFFPTGRAGPVASSAPGALIR